jgi:hydrogenase/urease accessory protein HupE
MRRGEFPSFVAVLALAAIALLASTARAHTMGLSRGEYTPQGPVVHARIVLRADEAALAVPGLDSDGDGRLAPREIERARPALQAAFVEPLQVEADGARCSGTLDDAALDPPDGLRLDAVYVCPALPAHLHLRFGFLDRLPNDHRHLATVHLARGDADTLALLARPDFDVDVGARPQRGFVSFVRGGVEHILTGADHLAFLLALVLGGTLASEQRARTRALVAMLTAFTVGHSGSLALATLGGFAPASRFVEPAVALSVAYVGAENLYARSVRRKWMLTLPFGFIHGFAFAGGLLPLGLARSELPLALFGFNLGVEVGQLLVLGLLLPPLAWLAGRSFYPRVAKGLSAGILLAGVVWFVERVIR